ncbi:MAG: hypothetical protein IPL65_21160 [Lewinellaceae bacterium]|nr:hypothetical protein [Lewinellaceae bacterium]
MKRLLVYLLLWGVAFASGAQTDSWKLRGMVRNEMDEPLPGATLLSGDQLLGFSDSDGSFNLLIPSVTVPLIVRCVGYFPQHIPSDSLHSTFLEIQLSPSAVSLPEVSVGDARVGTLFTEDFSTEIIDYTFAGAGLMMLVREQKSYFLWYCRDNGARISRLQFPAPVQQLHQSCTGAYHVVGEQFAWECTLNGQQLDTFPRYPAAKFHQIIAPCVQELNHYYFFRKTGPFRQSVQYTYIDPDKKAHPLAYIRDKKAENQLLDQYRSILYSYLKTIPDIDRDDILNGLSPLTDPMQALQPENLLKMAETNDLVAAIGFFNQLAYDSVYAPLIKLGDQVLLLDFVNDQQWTIAVNPWQDTIQTLQFHHEPGWRKQVLTDQPLGRIYACFSAKGGDLVLKSIDPKSVRPGKSYTPKALPYLCDHFSIRNGWLYCIGQPDVNTPNRKLYRLNLYSFEDP